MIDTRDSIKKMNNGAKLFLIGNIFFGVGITLTKYILLAIPMGVFLIGRHLVSGLSLMALAKATKRWRKLSWSDLKSVGVVGLINITLANILFVIGVQMVPSTHALLITLTGPVMVYILSYFILKERLERQATIGMIISISGILFLLVGQLAQFGVSERLLGVTLLLFSTLAASYAIIRAKRIMRSIDPMQMTAWQLIIGSIPFIAIFGWQLVTFDWLAVDIKYLIMFLMMVLVVSPIAFGAFYTGLSKVSVSSNVSFMYAQTVAGDIVAILVFGESLTTVYLISMSIVMLGVWIGRAQFSRRMVRLPLLGIPERLRRLGRFAFHRHGDEYHFFQDHG